MKDAEDEAFDEIARKQGAWGGGFKAKQAMAKARVGDDDDIQDYKKPWVDLSDSQIEQVYFDFVKRHRGAAMPWAQIQFGRTLQALIKEKNT